MSINQFRVWSNTKKCFLREDEVKINVHGEARDINGRLCELCQYTGVNDSAGTPIYSHDILDFVVKGAAHGREIEQYTAQEVYFDSECAAFMIGKNYSKSGDFYWGHSFLDEIDRASLKVVGNIFKGK